MASFINTTSGDSLVDQIRQLNTNITSGFNRVSTEIGAAVRGTGSSLPQGSSHFGPQFPSRYSSMPSHSASVLHGGMARLGWEALKPPQLFGSEKPQWMTQSEWQNITQQQFGVRLSEGVHSMGASAAPLGGMAVGSLLGFAVGGPIGSAIGGMLGSTVGDYVGRDARRQVEYRNLVRGLDDQLVRGRAFSKGVGGMGMSETEVKSMAKDMARIEDSTGYFERGQSAEFLSVGTQLGLFENAKSGSEVINMIREYEPVMEKISTVFKTSLEESAKIFKKFKDMMPDPKRAVEDIRSAAGLWGIDPQLTAAGMQLGAQYGASSGIGAGVGARWGGWSQTVGAVASKEGRVPDYLLRDAGGSEAVSQSFIDVMSSAFDTNYLMSAFDWNTKTADFSKLRGKSGIERLEMQRKGLTPQRYHEFTTLYEPLVRQQMLEQMDEGEMVTRFFEMYGKDSNMYKMGYHRYAEKDEEGNEVLGLNYWTQVLVAQGVPEQRAALTASRMMDTPGLIAARQRESMRQSRQDAERAWDRTPNWVVRGWRKHVTQRGISRGRRGIAEYLPGDEELDAFMSEHSGFVGFMNEGDVPVYNVLNKTGTRPGVTDSDAQQLSSIFGKEVWGSYYSDPMGMMGEYGTRGKSIWSNDVTREHMVETLFSMRNMRDIRRMRRFAPGGASSEWEGVVSDRTGSNRSRVGQLRNLLTDISGDDWYTRAITFFPSATKEELMRFARDAEARGSMLNVLDESQTAHNAMAVLDISKKRKEEMQKGLKEIGLYGGMEDWGGGDMSDRLTPEYLERYTNDPQFRAIHGVTGGDSMGFGKFEAAGAAKAWKYFQRAALPSTSAEEAFRSHARGYAQLARSSGSKEILRRNIIDLGLTPVSDQDIEAIYNLSRKDTYDLGSGITTEEDRKLMAIIDKAEDGIYESSPELDSDGKPKPMEQILSELSSAVKDLNSILKERKSTGEVTPNNLYSTGGGGIGIGR